MTRSLLRSPLSALFAALICLSACATFRTPAASFQVKCNVSEAVVLIDDVLVGSAANWAIPGRSIRAGFHRVEIRHPGYFSHYAEIDLPNGGGTVLTAELHPLLD